VWDLPGGRTGFTDDSPYAVVHTPIGDHGEENPNQGTAFIPDSETPEEYMKRQQGDRPDRRLGS